MSSHAYGDDLCTSMALYRVSSIASSQESSGSGSEAMSAGFRELEEKESEGFDVDGAAEGRFAGLSESRRASVKEPSYW